MKRNLFLLLAFCGMFAGALTVSAAEEEVELTAERIKTTPAGNDPDRGPVNIPVVCIDNYSLYISDDHPDYVLQLVDPDDEEIVIYQVLVPSTVSSIVLPSTLSGTYIIQLLWSDWRFWGYVELE